MIHPVIGEIDPMRDVELNTAFLGNILSDDVFEQRDNVQRLLAHAN